MAVVKYLSEIIRESVKPLENIDGTKIIQVEGLTGNGSGGNGAEPANGNLADQVVNSALRYRAQAPLVESLLKEVGLEGADINALTNSLNGTGSTDAGKAD